jgi:hypothetical protein
MKVAESGSSPVSVRGSAAAATPRVEFCRSGDEEELAAFDRRRGGAQSTGQYWRWKYFQNPAGPGCVAAAKVGGAIVGTLGYLPVRMRVHGRVVVASQQVDVAIMPEYRGGGIYFQLAHALIEEGMKRGGTFGFGFATDQTRALSVDFLGFDLVGPVRRLAKVLDYAHYAGNLLGPRTAGVARRVLAAARGRRGRRPRSRPGSITPVARFDARFDGLAGGLIPASVMVIRDTAYLNWRYVDCPTVAYGRYAAISDGAVSGLVVFHTYRAQGVVRGVIDELVCPADDALAVEGLVAAVLADLAEQGAVNAVCWLPAWHPLGPKLRALGFQDREARNELIVLRDKSPGAELDHLTEERNWYYTHGDSDFHVSPA